MASSMSLSNFMIKHGLDTQRGFAAKSSPQPWIKYAMPEKERELKEMILKKLCDQDPNYFLPVNDEKAEDIMHKCIKYSKKHNNGVCLSAIYTCVYPTTEKKYIVPVFRVSCNNDEKQTKGGPSYFIDDLGRVYKSFDAYLKENTMKDCWICVPDGGIYCHTKPDCGGFKDQTLKDKDLEFIDNANYALGNLSRVAGVAAFAASLHPLTAPYAKYLETAGIWGTNISSFISAGRCSYKLYDRFTHDQSISVFNPEARNFWTTFLLHTSITLGTALVIEDKYFQKGNRRRPLL